MINVHLLKGEDAMIGTGQGHIFQQAVHQLRAVLGQEREDRIAALLQMAMRKQKPAQMLRPGFGARASRRRISRAVLRRTFSSW